MRTFIGVLVTTLFGVAIVGFMIGGMYMFVKLVEAINFAKF